MADYVTLTGTDGVVHHVNPDRVSDVFPLPSSPTTACVLVLDWPPGVQAPPYLNVQGSAAAVSGLLAAPSGGGLNGTYSPIMGDIGGFYTPQPVGDWKWQRILNRVRVIGLATMDPPTTPPFGQVAQITVDVPFARTVAFTAFEDAPGIVQVNGTTPAPGWAVNIAASPVRALIGTFDTVEFFYVCDSNVGGLDIAVTFEYDAI
jgi:hypothetical protein